MRRADLSSRARQRRRRCTLPELLLPARPWHGLWAGLMATMLTLSGCTLLPGASGTDTARTTVTSGAAAVGGGSAVDSSADVRQAVSALVARRAAAVAAKDKAAWLATLVDPASAFGTAQVALYDRLTALPVSGLDAREVAVIPPSPPAAANAGAAQSSSPSSGATTDGADGSGTSPWVANLRLAYQFTGYDQGDRTFAVSYDVSRATDGWKLSGTGPGRTDAQPFDLPDATSVRSASTLVIGDVPAKTLDAYRQLGDSARQRIVQAWGSARPGVLVAPKTAGELQAQLGRGSFAGLDQVAAVTDGPLPTGQPAPSDRVYLNPDAFAKLSSNGRSVVVTHELTHVTIRGSTTRPVPIWLSEGYADDVAFASSGLPPKTVAADVLENVRKGTGPTALPDAADFDPGHGSIAPTYNAAYLAVLLMRQTYGQGKLNGFYRAVSGGPTADPAVTASADDLTEKAFVDILGLSQDAFVATWRSYLASLAR